MGEHVSEPVMPPSTPVAIVHTTVHTLVSHPPFIPAVHALRSHPRFTPSVHTGATLKGLRAKHEQMSSGSQVWSLVNEVIR